MKAIVSAVLIFVLLVLSRLFMRTCLFEPTPNGMGGICSQPESTFFLILMWIVVGYLAIIILLKIIAKK